MRIIQVTSYYPLHLGGMENVVKEISERLAVKGHQVEVFTSDSGNKNKKVKSVKNLKINYLKSWEFAHTPVIPSLFFRLIRIPKDSIIHVHIAQAFVPEIVWLVSKLRGIPYVAHIHIDVGPSGKLGFLLPFYKKVFLQKVLNASSGIIVPSRDYIELMYNNHSVPKNQIYEVANGIDVENFKYLPNKPQDIKKILFVGRLSKQKNIPLLIGAFKKLIEKNHQDMELHLVGEGEEKNSIIALIKEEKLEKKVIIHGELHEKSLYDIYSNSDILILPSLYESFGIVLIEAMASGLPIVASDIPAVRNVIENNKTGLLAALKHQDFAEAIERLLKNSSLRETLIKNGLEEVKKYKWDKILEKFEAIYMKVLSEKK